MLKMSRMKKRDVDLNHDNIDPNEKVVAVTPDDKGKSINKSNNESSSDNDRRLFLCDGSNDTSSLSEVTRDTHAKDDDKDDDK